LLRPPELLSARADFERGAITAAELREAEDLAVRAVVRMQEGIGFSVATDGEFRRSSWNMDFIYDIGGVTQTDDRVEVQFVNEQGRETFAPRALAIQERLHLDHVIFGDDFSALRDATTTALPKITIPSPNFVHHRGGGQAGIDRSIYSDPDEYWSDLIATYLDELSGLSELGCEYVQFDDTTFTLLLDPAHRARVRERGDDPDRQHAVYVEQLNRVLDARPEGMTVGVHMCRGNFKSSWAATGSYEFAAEQVFSGLHADALFLEYDDERSGGFEPLRFVPKSTKVVLGLVTSKRGELESKDALKRRIDEAGRFVDVGQLCLSPQCGFASDVAGNRVSHEEQLAKLRLVVETADEVWGGPVAP
jgi:5-methyltetrahydropteroyltriglutamate--homocysteine methyltransferase